VNVSFNLPEPQQKVIVQGFPELEFFFDKGNNYNGHAFAAVVRQATNRLVKLINRDVGPVIDLGGNPMTHLFDDHIHTCTPVLSTYDENRRVERQREILQHRAQLNQGKIYNATSLQRLEEAQIVMNDRDEITKPSVCSLKSQDCTHKAGTIISVDSIYDVNVYDFVKAMLTHGAGRATIAFIEPTALVLGATEGFDQLLGVSYSYVGLPSTDGYIANHADSTKRKIFTLVFGSESGGAVPSPRPVTYGKLKNKRDQDIIFCYVDGTVYVHSNQLLQWSKMANDGIISYGFTKVSYHKDHLGKRCGYTFFNLTISSTTDVPPAISRAILPAEPDYRVVLNWLSRTKDNTWTVTRPMITIATNNWHTLLTAVKGVRMNSHDDMQKMFDYLSKFAVMLSTRFIYRGVTVAQNEHIDSRRSYMIAVAVMMVAFNEKERSLSVFDNIFKRKNGLWRRFLRWMFFTRAHPGVVDHVPDDVPFWRKYDIQDGFNPLVYPPGAPVLVNSQDLAGFFSPVRPHKVTGQMALNQIEPEVLHKLHTETEQLLYSVPKDSESKPLLDFEDDGEDNVMFDVEKSGSIRSAPISAIYSKPVDSISNSGSAPPSYDNLSVASGPTHNVKAVPPQSGKVDPAKQEPKVTVGRPLPPSRVAPTAPEVEDGSQSTEPEQLIVVDSKLDVIVEGDKIGNFVVVHPRKCPTTMRDSLEKKRHGGYGKIPPLNSYYVQYTGEDFPDKLAVEEYMTVLVS
jgi:hypothetical protein